MKGKRKERKVERLKKEANIFKLRKQRKEKIKGKKKICNERCHRMRARGVFTGCCEDAQRRAKRCQPICWGGCNYTNIRLQQAEVKKLNTHQSRIHVSTTMNHEIDEIIVKFSRNNTSVQSSLALSIFDEEIILYLLSRVITGTCSFIIFRISIG